MIKLLSKIFIKDRENYESPAVRSAYGVLCGGFGIFLNVLLFVGKYIAGTIARSVAITADSFNNLADAASSIMTMLGFHLSRQKPDTEHPFGHGRIEYITGLLVSAAIILMGVELLKSSFTKILHPEAIEFSWLTAAILIAGILVKLYMFMYNRATGKKINSSALHATAQDSLSDCIATSVVLAASIVSHFFKLNIDGYCGLAVALFVIYSGIMSVKDTITPLLGETPDPELIKKIEALVLSYPEISGIHDLIVHDYGPGRLMISVHAEVPVTADFDVFAMHDVIDNAERRLAGELGCEATIHLDPVASDDELTTGLKKRITEIVTSISDELTLHDFRVVPGPSHTNLIFDVVVPFDSKLSFDEIKSGIDSAVESMNDGIYYAVVHFDRPLA